MSHENWLEAARKYGAKRQAQQPEPQQPTPATAVAVARVTGTTVAEISNALSGFLRSAEGIAATTLLRASEQFVRLAEANEGGGSGFVIFLDGNGLQESIEAMGMWVAYAKKEDVPKPQLKPISTEEAAQGIVSASEGRATAEQVLSNLRADLDRIAAQVDK